MALRILRSDATKTKQTPQGGLEVEAVVTKPGVFTYYDAAGRAVREYRPPEEVFKLDALGTLEHAPVTNLHHGLITADNWREFAVGHVAGKPRREGDHIVCTLVIQDAETLADVRAGRSEVSCGTIWDIDPTPGVTPTGERYDCVQRSPRYNHVAIVPRARLGSDTRLRLDGAGSEVEILPMRTIRFDGKDWPVNTDEEVAALNRAMVAKDSATQARLDAADARATAAEAKVSQVQARFDAAVTPDAIDARVRARSGLVATAAKVLPELKCDGLPDLEIQTKVCAKVYPSLKLDGKDASYISALFEGVGDVVKATQARLDAAATRVVEAPPAGDKTPETREDSAPDLEAAQKRSAQRAANAWKTPLAASRGK